MKDTTPKIAHVFSAKEATHVFRNPTGSWEWSDVAHVMVSNAFEVLGFDGLGIRGAKGGPLSHEFAANMLETLYRKGYAVVRLEPTKANTKKAVQKNRLRKKTPSGV